MNNTKWTYGFYMTIQTDLNAPKEEREKYLKEKYLAVEKFVKNIIDADNLVLVEFELEDIHTGSFGIGDAYVGGGYQAVDADDPSYIKIRISAYNMEYIQTIYRALKNPIALEFVDEVTFERE